MNHSMRANPVNPTTTPTTIPPIVPPLRLELDERSSEGVMLDVEDELADVDEALDDTDVEVVLIVVDAQ